MESNILVAYDSKHGATAEVAERISGILKEKGLKNELVSLEKTVDPSPYDVIILGTAIYAGQWRKHAVKFLKEYQQQLASKKCWIFSTGPTGTGDPKELVQGWEYPPSMKKTLESIAPRDMAIFHGVIDMEKLNKLERMAIKMVKAPTGDFRDWGSVRQWAEGIAANIRNN